MAGRDIIQLAWPSRVRHLLFGGQPVAALGASRRQPPPRGGLIRSLLNNGLVEEVPASIDEAIHALEKPRMGEAGGADDRHGPRGGRRGGVII